MSFVPSKVETHLRGISDNLITSLHAIRQSMIWLIPCLVMSSFALFVASMGEFIWGRGPWVDSFYAIHSSVGSIFPYLMTATISYILAMQWRVPRPPVALLSILYIVISTALIKSNDTVEMLHIVMAIVTPLYAVPLIAYLFSFKFLHITSSDSAGAIVKESLNLVFPALITLFVAILVNVFLLSTISGFSLDSLLIFDYANDPYTFGSVFAVLNSVFWFVGIHGYYALLPMVEVLQQASDLTHSTVMAGGIAPYIMNLSFMGSFVFIGGSGATLSLILALLIVSKHKTLRLIAITSIPIAFINVNEILLFGLPIIFNPRLFIPFLLAPIVNVISGLMIIEMGWVNAPSVPIPINAPLFINALIATQGDWHAVVLQLFNLALGTLIYIPAVIAINRVYGQREIKITALDTTYMRRHEEAQTLSDDPISLAQQRESAQVTVEKQLRNMNQKEFCVEYQPQINPQNGEVVGCEALVRAIDNLGRVHPPSDFLPWLEKAGLMKDMDLWVFKKVVQDIQYWQNAGISVPVSVNITPETIVDEEYVKSIATIIEPVKGLVHLEITEDSMLINEHALEKSLDIFHQLGAKIYIDDFGTGYSSLSYLNRFDIDAIKIDRSFVLALETEKGQKVFSSLQSVATELELMVVVEGVETEKQLQSIFLNSGCSVQGWLYSRSLPLDGFIEYVHQRSEQA